MGRAKPLRLDSERERSKREKEEEHQNDDSNDDNDDGDEGDDEDGEEGEESDGEEIELLHIATGLDTNSVMNLNEVLEKATEHNLNFVCVPLFHPRLRVDPNSTASSARGGLITRSDMALDNQDWTENVIGKVSEWIDLDNCDTNIRRASEEAIRKEHLYAGHLGLQSIIVPAPRQINSPNYARTIMNLTYSNVDIWLVIPFLFRDPTHKLGTQNAQQLQQLQQNGVPVNNNNENNENSNNDDNDDDNEVNRGAGGGGKRKRMNAADNSSVSEFNNSNISPITIDCNANTQNKGKNNLQNRGQNKGQINAQNSAQNNGENNGQNAPVLSATDPDGWKVWDFFRHISGSDKRVHIALEFKTYKVAGGVTQDYFDKWISEPVKAVIIWTTAFKINTNKGYANIPTLSNGLKKILLALCDKFELHVIIKGRPHGHCSLAKFYECVDRVLEEKNETRMENGDGPSIYDCFTRKYRDSLRSPLQPLMENLDSKTYSVMEEDPVKYDTYQAAISGAITDKWVIAVALHGDQAPPVVVMVVGAGRGPLVIATLNASAISDIPVKIYAVEKNLHAVITLRNRAQHLGWKNVQIIEKDMRNYRPTEQADIMVSELLGSWGDNELSPECLDIAQERCLKPDGISIPTSYTSFIAPMSSSKLWSAARDMPVMQCDNFIGSSGPRARTGLDSPYVVHFHNCRVLAKAEPLFEFSHPSTLPSDMIDNSRYATATFNVKESTTIHGFSGTFECVLYKDIVFSTVPHTFSEGMFSWFPLFIPLLTPLSVTKGETLTVAVWRCVSAQKVWYEWCLSAPTVTSIQNPNGLSYWVGL